MKKLYSRPVLAALGSATEQTQGKREADVNDYFGGYRYLH